MDEHSVEHKSQYLQVGVSKKLNKSETETAKNRYKPNRIIAVSDKLRIAEDKLMRKTCRCFCLDFMSTLCFTKFVARDFWCCRDFILLLCYKSSIFYFGITNIIISVPRILNEGRFPLFIFVYAVL